MAGIRPSRASVKPNTARVDRDRDVGAGDEPDAAAERVAVDPRDHRLGAGVDRLEHGRARRPRRRRFAPSAEVAARRASTRCRRRRRRRCLRRSARSPASRRRPARRTAAVSSAISAGPSAFRTSGRFRVSVATAPSRVSRTLAHIRNTPKVVSGTGARGAAARPSASTWRVSQRVDHAVVPQPRGRVVGRCPHARSVSTIGASNALALGVVHARRARSRAPAAAWRRPSPRCARSATSTAAAASRRGRTWRSCRRRS